jgi:RNA-binding protein YlmH
VLGVDDTNSISSEDKSLISNLYDKIKLAELTYKPVFTNEFVSPNVWKGIENLQVNFDVNIFSYGIFQDSERRILAFSKDKVYDYPVKIIRIENKSKFIKLEHRDYLGALVGLGIKREKLGDLVIDEGICYAAICEDIFDYLKLNLNKVGNCPCEISLVNLNNVQQIKKNTMDSIVSTTSLRLDCIVSSLCNLSRTKAVLLIQSSKVLVDYCEVLEKDFNVEIDSIITIRGYGKFKISEQTGATQKGRLKLLVKKYI